MLDRSEELVSRVGADLGVVRLSASPSRAAGTPAGRLRVWRVECFDANGEYCCGFVLRELEDHLELLSLCVGRQHVEAPVLPYALQRAQALRWLRAAGIAAGRMECTGSPLGRGVYLWSEAGWGGTLCVDARTGALVYLTRLCRGGAPFIGNLRARAGI